LLATWLGVGCGGDVAQLESAPRDALAAEAGADAGRTSPPSGDSAAPDAPTFDSRAMMLEGDGAPNRMENDVGAADASPREAARGDDVQDVDAAAVDAGSAHGPNDAGEAAALEAGEREGSADGSADRPRWPTTRSPLPPCVTDARAFVAPQLGESRGDVAWLRSTPLEPVLHDVRIPIEVRVPATGALDTTAQGALDVASDQGVAFAAPVSVVDGRAEVVVRFAEPGLHALHAQLSDGRMGTVEIEAFASQLPVWELQVNEADLAAVLADPGGRLKASVVVTQGGVSYPGKVRLHGGSSRYYPKPSLRVDLDSGQVLPDGSSHVIFRSEWNDKTMLRNYLSSELMQNGTWVPSFRTEPVHLRVNQRYYGAMLRVERVDKEFLAQRGLSIAGSLYEPDPPLALSSPGGNLTPLASREAYAAIYQHQAGTIDYDDLIHLIENTLAQGDGASREQVAVEVAIDDVLVFLAGMAVIQNHDHIRKNYYLYRDPVGADARWRLFPWDLDLTFGHLYTDDGDVLDERIFTDESLYFGERVPEHDFYNQLTTRLLAVPAHRSRFVEYAKHIAEDVLTDAFIDGRIDNFLCRATPDLLADTRKRAANDEYLGRVEEIRAFVRGRRAFVLAAP